MTSGSGGAWTGANPRDDATGGSDGVTGCGMAARPKPACGFFIGTPAGAMGSLQRMMATPAATALPATRRYTSDQFLDGGAAASVKITGGKVAGGNAAGTRT